MICALSLRMIWLCSAKRSLEISLSLSLSSEQAQGLAEARA